KMLCTLLAPTGGRATVAGFDIASRPQQVRLHIGVALQDVALDPKQTGLELLRLQGQLYGLSRREIEQRVVELRALVDLGDALESRDHELTISVDEGSSAIGPVAIALHDASIQVRDLTLRTPTLDDVFLELTGAHFDAEEDRS